MDRTLTLLLLQQETQPHPLAALQEQAETWFVEDPRPLDVREEIGALARLGHAEQAGAGWRLTPAGAHAARAAHKRVLSDSFDRALLSLRDSPVYAEHCRRVYGVDRFQFDMLDRVQAEALFGLCDLGPGDRFVDLGCALGSLTAWIAQRSGAHGLGLDLAPGLVARAAVDAADVPRVSFATGDLDALSLPAGALDVAIAVDTLHFAADLSATLAAIFDGLAPGGRLVASYTANQRASDPPEATDIAHSRLAEALAAAGARIAIAHEHTEGDAALWQRSADALRALRDRWEAEGRGIAWRARDAETRSVLARHRDGTTRRWLVVAVRDP